MFSGPALGLYSSPNPFSQTPAGTLKTADNVRFTAPGVIEPRRGFNYLVNGEFGDPDSLADSLAFYAGTILLAYDLTNVALYTPSGGFTDFEGTFLPVGDNRMRFEGAARSCFFNTSQGLKAWDGVGFDGEPVTAGCPQGLDIVATNTADDGWQEPDTAVAYRFTICRKDAFGRIVEGPPSGRTILRNSIVVAVNDLTYVPDDGETIATVFANPYVEIGDVLTLTPGEMPDFPPGDITVTSASTAPGLYYEFRYAAPLVPLGPIVHSTTVQRFEATRSAEVSLRFPGSQVSTQNFLRVYRSYMTLTGAASPSDELWQCYESPLLTDADVAAGSFTFRDTAPESTLEVPLYTNTNTGNPVGILAARYQPPVSLDVAYWANRMWFANTTQKQSLQVTLLGTGTPDGIQAGDTLTIEPEGVAEYSFTAVAEWETPGIDEFTAYISGDPGFNIQRTAQSICSCINNSDDHEDVYAFYVSSEAGLPGQILLVSREFGDEHAFELFSDRSAAWSPQLPDHGTPLFAAPASDNNRHPAGLSYSPLGIPDAVPPLNNLVVNSDNDATLRIFPLHYRLLIFKTDGIYTCTNVEPFSIQKLSAYQLLAPDSVQVLEDRVYALTDQGIITISDAGVVEISDPIDDVFNALNAPTSIDDLRTLTFGMSYRSERQALVWCIEKDDNGTFSDDNEQAFALSTLSEGFTRYPFGVRCGAIDPEGNSMVIAPTDDNWLRGERKTLTDADYCDLQHSIGSPVSVTGVTLTFSTPSAALMEAGDVLTDGVEQAVITEVDGTTITINDATSWTAASTLVLYEAFDCELEFNKLTAGTPAELKMMQQASLLFRQNGIHDVTATFTSEITTAEQTVTLSAQGWGEFAWGDLPWGSPTQQIRRIEPLPEPVAQCAQLSVGFRTRQALKKFEFLGLDVQAKKDSSVNHG